MAQHLNLHLHGLGVVHLGVAAAKDRMPEEGHLLFQGPVGGNHALEPPPLGLRQAVAVPGSYMVPAGQVFFPRRLLLWVKEFFHGSLVTLGRSALQLVSTGAEPGSAHEVCHEGNIFFRHSANPLMLESRVSNERSVRLEIYHISNWDSTKLRPT